MARSDICIVFSSIHIRVVLSTKSIPQEIIVQLQILKCAR